MDDDLLTLDDVLTLLREECRGYGGGRRFAEKAGINHQYLSHVVNGDFRPGPAIFAALAVAPVTLFRRQK